MKLRIHSGRRLGAALAVVVATTAVQVPLRLPIASAQSACKGSQIVNRPVNNGPTQIGRYEVYFDQTTRTACGYVTRTGPAAKSAAYTSVRITARDGAYSRKESSTSGRSAVVSLVTSGTVSISTRINYGKESFLWSRDITLPAKSPSSSSTREKAVSTALKYQGTPYKWGGATPKDGFDCSGLVQYAYKQAGVTLPRVTTDQYFALPRVTTPQRGDLVFNSDLSHVGIYLGDGQMVHAPRAGTVVKTAAVKDVMGKTPLYTRP